MIENSLAQDIQLVNAVSDPKIVDVYYRSLKDPPRCHKDGWKTCSAHFSQDCNGCMRYTD